MKAREMDDRLRIRTEGTLELLSQSPHYNRYEATPYEALGDLFSAYDMGRTDGFVDYGCGKGRVSFYVHDRFGVPVTGIEMNARLYEDAMANWMQYQRKNRRKRGGSLRFERQLAETYEVEPVDSRFYFFNPFSIEIFINVISRLLGSFSDHPRQMDVILYYPTVEYLHFLETSTPFGRLMEVPVAGLSEQDENERFVIYRLDVHPEKPSL